ncbi:MAG: ABC transporter substrate-binding protein, partial [Pseudomonadota bacterium]
MRPTWLIGLTLAALLPAVAQAEPWEDVVAEAAGQTVYFNAWGGDLAINQYIDWARERLRDEYDVELRHVRVADIAEAVARIVAERAGGRDSGGSVDLLW